MKYLKYNMANNGIPNMKYKRERFVLYHVKIGLNKFVLLKDNETYIKNGCSSAMRLIGKKYVTFIQIQINFTYKEI